MDRDDMGSGLGKDAALVSTTTQAVKEVAKIPVWAKLTPATADIAEEAGATFRGGADAITSSNTFPSLPPIDPDTLDFEIHVDGFVSPGGLGGPAILMQSLAKMAQMTQAFPDREFSGVGGISTWADALSYLLLGCGTVQVATAAMLDKAIGPNVVRGLIEGMEAFLEQHADRGWTTLEDFRGLRRDAVVAQSQIARPPESGYDPDDPGEGYARAVTEPAGHQA
jgi:dihydroorotate dehydrogenase